jgi:microcystin-dependent protein
MDCYIGSIVLWAGSYIPVGWAECNGALLPASENTAMYYLLGTTYGGHDPNYSSLLGTGNTGGVLSFALPNLPQVADIDGKGSSKYIICLEGIFPSHP